MSDIVPRFPTGQHQFRLNGRCPVCRAMYDFTRLRILGERAQRVLAYLECQVCGTAVLTILSMNPAGLTASGLVTDLRPDEVERVHARQSVTGDDVLAVHEALERDENFFAE